MTIKNNKLAILLVEDSMLVQMICRRKLEQYDCRVDIADTGEQAVELFQRNAYDAIFMDIGLPKMNGCEATAAIREHEQISGGHVPVVAITAHVDATLQEQYLATGIDRVFEKPLTDAMIEEILMELCALP